MPLSAEERTMADLSQKDYVVIVQCHTVKEYCSGYSCEKALHERTGGFADYPRDKQYRALYLTCGGCCGKTLHRKLTHLIRKAGKHGAIPKDRIVVQLSSCITRDNHHAPPCPNLNYLKTLIAKLGLDMREDTSISKSAEQRRQAGIYLSRPATQGQPCNPDCTSCQ
jgi:predicted metal-binding protein